MLHERGMIVRCATAGITLALLGACTTNSTNGVPRLVGASKNGSGIYGADGPISSCPQTSAGLNIVTDFVRRACDSHANPSDPVRAALMVNAGVTVNRIRCADFFRQRGAGQTTGRVLRRAIAPLSALITGVLGIVNFKTDAGRQEAQQILALSSSALEGGLSVYESEFLFDADNIRSVEMLTMRDLDVHGTEIIDNAFGFYQGLRHLLDHQSKCRPTHILQLAQTAIKEGDVQRTGGSGAIRAAAIASADSAVLTQVSANAGVGDLTADQAGFLWWRATDRASFDQLPTALVVARLGPKLADIFYDVAASPPLARQAAQSLFTGPPSLFTYSAETKNLFDMRKLQIQLALGRAGAADPVAATKDLQFGLSTAQSERSSGAVETAVVPRAQQ